jgi:hypothetical protein
MNEDYNLVFNKEYFTGKEVLSAYNENCSNEINKFKTLEDFIDKAIIDAYNRGQGTI